MDDSSARRGQGTRADSLLQGLREHLGLFKLATTLFAARPKSRVPRPLRRVPPASTGSGRLSWSKPRLGCRTGVDDLRRVPPNDADHRAERIADYATRFERMRGTCPFDRSIGTGTNLLRLVSKRERFVGLIPSDFTQDHARGAPVRSRSPESPWYNNGARFARAFGRDQTPFASTMICASPS